MNNFKRSFGSGNNRGGRWSGGRDERRGDSGGRGFRDRGRDRGGYGDRDDRPVMHETTCDKCGKRCEVPFRPSGDKPVYCNDCFQQEGRGGDERSFGRRDRDSGRGRDRDRSRSFGRDRGNDRAEEREMFEAVCDSCGETCQVPFKPRGDKAVFCDKCFGSGNRPLGGDSSPVSAEQFDIINAKLDKIIGALFPLVPLKTLRENKLKKMESAPKKSAENVINEKVDTVPKTAVKKQEQVKEAKKKGTTKKEVKQVAPKKVSTKKPVSPKKAVKKTK